MEKNARDFGDSFLKGVVTQLREVNIPSCQSCNKQYELKLTTVNSDTQEGFGEYVSTCDCKS